MEYLQLTMDEYVKHTEGVKTEMTNGVKAFVRMGWHLYMVDASGGYKLGGYKNLEEYTKANFKMDRSRASRYINVYKKYCIPGSKPELKEKYKGFELSQLEEMLSLPEEDEEMIRPEMRKEEIRELKRFNKDNKNNPAALLNWNQDPEDHLKNALRIFFKERKDSLNALYQSEAYQNNDVAMMKKIIRNGQRKSFKDSESSVFMVLYENEATKNDQPLANQNEAPSLFIYAI